MTLSGKTALITGGTRGIGLAIAKKFAEHGAKLILLAAHGGERAESAVSELQKIGAEIGFYVCDVSDAARVSETVTKVLADFGTVDILVNNAGITRDNLLPSLGTADIDDVIDINLKGTIFMH